MNREKKENTFPKGTLNGGKLELKRAESALVEHFTWAVLKNTKGTKSTESFPENVGMSLNITIRKIGQAGR